MVNTDWSDSSD